MNFRGYNANLQVNSVKVTYLDFPVTLESLLGAHSKNESFIGAGGYFGLALAGKYKTNLSFNSTEWQTLKIGEKIDDNRSSSDYGLVLMEAFGLPEETEWLRWVCKRNGAKNVVPKRCIKAIPIIVLYV